MASIEIRELQGTWVVRAGGAVLGETQRAIGLTEGDLPEVVYFPRQDVAMAMLDVEEKVTRCPHKGQARHFAIVTKSRVISGAAWSYENPSDEVAAIAGHVAFRPSDLVTIEQL